MVLGAVALAGLSALFVGVTASHSSSPGLPAWVSDSAIHMAMSKDGGAMPSSAEWALTNAHATARAVGLTSGNATEADRQQVYIVVVHGNFVDNSWEPPWSNPRVPQGDTLVLVYDVALQRVTDESLGSGPVDTSAVGLLTPMPLN
jgi:hypothetical protein